MKRVDTAEVHLWDREIGAVAWDSDRQIGHFEFAERFLGSGIELAPLMMPLGRAIFSFPELNRVTFQGLPGMLSDSLPDRFGNLLIDRWLAGQGRKAKDFSPVERLCYVGDRGMGGLEFFPAMKGTPTGSEPLEVQQLVRLANEALAEKGRLQTWLDEGAEATEQADALREIIQVGTSAGGARAKAVIAWNPETGEIRSGQTHEKQGYEPWLIKFDGVAENRDKELADPLGYGRIEFAYHLMAREAGILMSDCRLIEENGRAHFLTRRFDRALEGRKIHFQSLCAIGHFDFNLAGETSYEQAIQTMRRLRLPRADFEQQFSRTVFNLVARNQDDHTKNIAFLMERDGSWRLSPAYDVIFAYNPSGKWTGSHQMSVNGKRDDFELEDLLDFAEFSSIRNRQAKSLISRIEEAVARWPEFAAEAGVEEERIEAIGDCFRRFLI
ncbi:MAG: type II toxin-antitoxin system HipA family toxin [Verrucomicrobiota bacterium]